MTFPRSPNPVEKLAIAVVPVPLRALPMPAGAREDAMRHLLGGAADAGVVHVATRPDGDGERILGQSWPFPTPFRVSVRTVSVAEGVDRVEARARRSLERMGLPRGETLLVANAQDLAGAEGRALWDKLTALKDRGLYRRIGFCAKIEDGPSLLARRFKPDVVQLPCNLLDQRALRSGVLAELKAQDVAVHLSSVFARGALFAARETLPPHLIEHGPALSRTRRRLAEARVDPMQAALTFALGLHEADAVIASVVSAAELRAIIAAAHAPQPSIDWSTLALECAAAQRLSDKTMGAMRISDAA